MVLVAMLALVATPKAAAGDDVSQLAAKLKHADFRVRTQAALSLGRSRSTRAVKPLCRALRDRNSTVRVSAAWAIAKLKRGGDGCLEAQLRRERSASVKKKIRRALSKMTGGGGAKLAAGTRYYLAIGSTKDNTGRRGREVHRLVSRTLRQASSTLARSVVAPSGETSAQAKARLRKHSGVDAYLLNPVVHQPAYRGGELTIRLDVLCYSYPNKVLKGTVSRTASLRGVGNKDKKARENELIEALSNSAMKQVAQLVPQIE